MLKEQNGVGVLHDGGDRAIADNMCQADSLNNYVCFVSTVNNDSILLVQRFVPNSLFIDEAQLLVPKVLAASQKLKSSKSCGPDGYTPLLLLKNYNR